MKLPVAIQTFFNAENAVDLSKAPINAFSPEAIVKDEGKTYSGENAIKSWWTAAKTRFNHVAEPLNASEDGGVTKVRASVTGNFPTSPAVLTFAFQLKNGKISALEITS